jgi:hypothetical protein
MNELYFLTETAQDVLNKTLEHIEKNEFIRAITTLGELKYILDIMAIEQEKAAEANHNGQVRN